MADIKKQFDYEVLFRMAPDAKLIISGNRIIDLNSAALSMFGYTSEEDLIGREVYHLSPFLQPDGQESCKKGKRMISEAKQNEVLRFEWEHQKADGEHFFAEISLVVLSIENENVVYALMRDISDKKKKEIELAENEVIYRSMFEKNAANLMLIDPDNGNIVDVNSSACEFYGYDKNKLVTMKMSDLYLSNTGKVWKYNMRSLGSLGRKLQTRHKASNGEAKDVEICFGLLELKNHEYLYAIVHDITDKVAAIRNLKENHKKFRMLFNNTTDSLFLHGINKDGYPGNFMEVNNTACKKLGYSRNDMKKMSPKDIDIPCHSGITNQIIDRIIKNKQATFETIHITKSGNQIPVEISSHAFRFNGEKVLLSIARDISERKAIEEATRRSNEKYKKLMEFLPDAVFILDNHNVKYVNPSGVKLLGFENNEDFIGKPFLDFVQKDYRNAERNRLRKLQSDSQPDLLTEIKYIRSDGAIIDVEVTATKMPFEDSDKSIIIVARDITEKNKAKAQLMETKEYERVKTEFFANISHELRTPLNVVLGALQLLELRMKDSAAFSSSDGHIKYIKMMKQNCNRLLRIISNIIDLTKIDSGYFNIEMGNHDIVSMIRGITLSVYEYVKQNNINLEFSSEIESELIACDWDAIERIILNLLSNAVKFTNPGGRIEVSISERSDKVVVIVEDTGIGIPKDKLEVIFDRFRQVDKSLTRNREGSGIGLSLVKYLIEAQGGSISLDSEYGKGSRFTIEMPKRQILIDNERSNETKDKGSFNVERISVEFSDIYL